MAGTSTTSYTPTAFLLAVGAVVVGAVGIVATAPLWREPASMVAAAPPAISMTLRFDADSAGNLTVRKVPGGEMVDHLDPDASGFARTMVRVIRRDLGPGANVDSMPFQLNAWQDGRLALVDTATGRSVDLRAFGPTQAGLFLRWIQQEEARGR
jgi:putative photosynthetic complex assembly protein